MIPFADEELVEPVKKVIEKIRPSIALDGGDIAFVAVKNSKVYIQLRGACVTCPSSSITLKQGVERQLRIAIHPELEVVNVPAGREDDLDNL